jgi:hypothetical protein
MSNIFFGISFNEDFYRIDVDEKTDIIINFLTNKFNPIIQNNSNIYFILFPEYTFSNKNNRLSDDPETIFHKKMIPHTQKKLVLEKLENFVRKFTQHKIIFIASTIPSAKIFDPNKHPQKYHKQSRFLKKLSIPSHNNDFFDFKDSLLLQTSQNGVRHTKLKNSLYIISNPRRIIIDKSLEKHLVLKEQKNIENDKFVQAKYSKIAPYLEKETLLPQLYNQYSIKFFPGIKVFQPGNHRDSYVNIIDLETKSVFTILLSICADYTHHANHTFLCKIANFYDHKNIISFVFSDPVEKLRYGLFAKTTIHMDTKSGLNIYKENEDMNNIYYHFQLGLDNFFIRKEVNHEKINFIDEFRKAQSLCR